MPDRELDHVPDASLMRALGEQLQNALELGDLHIGGRALDGPRLAYSVDEGTLLLEAGATPEETAAAFLRGLRALGPGELRGRPPRLRIVDDAG